MWYRLPKNFVLQLWWVKFYYLNCLMLALASTTWQLSAPSQSYSVWIRQDSELCNQRGIYLQHHLTYVYIYSDQGMTAPGFPKKGSRAGDNTLTLLFVQAWHKHTQSDPMQWLTFTHAHPGQVQGKQARTQVDLYREMETAVRREPGNTRKFAALTEVSITIQRGTVLHQGPKYCLEQSEEISSRWE